MGAHNAHKSKAQFPNAHKSKDHFQNWVKRHIKKGWPTKDAYFANEVQNQQGFSAWREYRWKWNQR
jgi:hypothetical protein